MGLTVDDAFTSVINVTEITFLPDSPDTITENLVSMIAAGHAGVTGNTGWNRGHPPSVDGSAYFKGDGITPVRLYAVNWTDTAIEPDGVPVEYSGLTTNIFHKFSLVDDSSEPSWFWGVVNNTGGNDDYLVMARLDPGSTNYAGFNPDAAPGTPSVNSQCFQGYTPSPFAYWSTIANDGVNSYAIIDEVSSGGTISQNTIKAGNDYYMNFFANLGGGVGLQGVSNSNPFIYVDNTPLFEMYDPSLGGHFIFHIDGNKFQGFDRVNSGYYAQIESDVGIQLSNPLVPGTYFSCAFQHAAGQRSMQFIDPSTSLDLFSYVVGGVGSALSIGPDAFVANGSVATNLGSVGPAGSHTTVQEWLAIKHPSSGVVRYLACF